MIDRAGISPVTETSSRRGIPCIDHQGELLLHLDLYCTYNRRAPIIHREPCCCSLHLLHTGVMWNLQLSADNHLLRQHGTIGGIESQIVQARGQFIKRRIDSGNAAGHLIIIKQALYLPSKTIMNR